MVKYEYEVWTLEYDILMGRYYYSMLVWIGVSEHVAQQRAELLNTQHPAVLESKEPNAPYIPWATIRRVERKCLGSIRI